jgi:hypothetical protein
MKKEIAFIPNIKVAELKKIKETVGFKSWLEENTQIDESFGFCVLKEYVLKCYICEQNNIPYYLDTIPENSISVFDVPQTSIDIMWNELMKEDIQRKIEYGTWQEFCEYVKIYKKAFVKVYDKCGRGKWTHKIIDITNTTKKLAKLIKEAGEDYNFPLLEDFEEFNGNDVEKLLFVLGYNREYSDKYLFTTVHKVQHEHRFVLSRNKIISYSPQSLDCEELRKPIDKIIVNSMVEFVEKLAKKYWDKVPYKIWNIDIALFDGKIDIVEGHFNCNRLGFYFDNMKKFKEVFEII